MAVGIAGALARFPLTVCDRISIDRDDLEYDLNPYAKPKPFNAPYCEPNDAQRWHWYSAMSRDEALVFTTYDSHPADGEVFCPTLHAAIPIPGSEGLQERERVEVVLLQTCLCLGKRWQCKGSVARSSTTPFSLCANMRRDKLNWVDCGGVEPAILQA